ncbi:GSCFA domain-containing protein [Nitrosomonas communis]|uniref:GSCFA domain-containing protein n=1 Tax=Nitrosomonas communis TaxID=44574 RepID=UPI003D2BD37A
MIYNLIISRHPLNPGINILLTVSPVPLVATYENRHVLVSTTASKAILRAAADEAERIFDNVIYFPSYEIITSPANGGRYYADDLRDVTDNGVQHVMRVFNKHFMQETESEKAVTQSAPSEVYEYDSRNVTCDEEEIARAVKQSGF